jgi:hypothetical protein
MKRVVGVHIRAYHTKYDWPVVGYFIVGCSVVSVAFYYLCGYFPLLMPYWLFYVSHVDDRFINTPRL